MSHTDRVIVLIDMDCFYCQVEEKLDPNLEGKPIAVVQYNAWKGGGIIAVNYPARDRGVTRHMRGDEAKEKCPEIHLARVPQVRGKADLTKYREAGKRVADVLKTFTDLLERASIDEAYLDITKYVENRLSSEKLAITAEKIPNTFVVGCETPDFLKNVYDSQSLGFSDSNVRLLVGAAIVEEIRAEVFKQTGYKCSAGIAHNKILAKLVCSYHKPNKQTLLPQEAVPEMFAKLPIRKIKSLGGKFGNTLSEVLNIEYIGELLKFSEKQLIQKFDEKNGKWLYNIARGIDKEPVTIKLISKSIGCCKRFPGQNSLCTAEDVEHWIKELSSEISERLEKDLEENNRKGKLMTVSFAQETKGDEIHSSRACPLKSYDIDKISEDAFNQVKKHCKKPDGSYHVTFLGLSISNFEPIKNVRSITSYFQKNSMNDNLSEPNKGEVVIKNNETKSTKSNSNTTSSKTNIKDLFSIVERKNIDHNQKNNSVKNCNIPENHSLLNESSGKKNNLSVYSASTESLNEDLDELIFWDETNNTENNSKSTFENKELDLKRSSSVTSVGSLENELYLEDPNSSPILNEKESFFARYFQKEEPSTSVQRDFDTSKIFESDDSEDNTHEMEQIEESTEYEEINENSEKCTECGERIPILEMISHMDYHYALKLSKEFNVSQSTTSKKPNVSPQKSKTNVGPQKAKKRKIEDSQMNSLTTFLKAANKNSTEETEKCEECGKEIPISELENHSDYHTAKKLHLELNSFTKKIDKVEDKPNSCVKSKNTNNILHYFKANS